MLHKNDDAPLSVGLLLTSDQLVAETSNRQHTTLTTDKNPCRRWGSNPQSRQIFFLNYVITAVPRIHPY